MTGQVTINPELHARLLFGQCAYSPLRYDILTDVLLTGGYAARTPEVFSSVAYSFRVVPITQLIAFGTSLKIRGSRPKLLH